MKTPPHWHGLVWVAVIGYVAALVLGVIAATMGTQTYYGVDSDAVGRQTSVAGVSSLALLVAIIATLLAITLAGVQHLLEQSRDGERSTPDGVIGHEGVDLRRGDAGVPEQPLDGQ